MKLRTAFVSNSSSASFIIRWKALNDTNLDHIVLDIDGIGAAQRNILKKKTTILKDGSFETEFFTFMYNDHRDFGKVCMNFIMNLLTKYTDYKIISTTIDEDN